MFITSIEEGGYRPYEFKDDIQLSVVFERDLDLHRVDREVYSVLDLLGDVGGLYEATKMICFTILCVLFDTSEQRARVAIPVVKISI